MGLSGMKSLRRKVQKIDRNLQDEVVDAVEDQATVTASDARSKVAQQRAIWTGNLARNIYATKGVTVNDRTRIVIRADVPYAAYVEFGTGPRGDPTAPLQFQFDAPSHTPELTRDIREWVMTKPTFFGPRTEGVAWAIASKIAEEGTYPHLFFRPAWFENEQLVIQRAGYAAKRVITRA